MRKLDRTRDFGTFKGEAFVPPGGDRVAVYTQDNLLFDVNDRLIEPGVPLAAARARRQRDQRWIDAAAAVLPELDKLKPDVIEVVGKVLLGVKACPATTEDIIAAIRKLAGSKAAASVEDDDTGEVPPGGPVNGHKGVSPQSMIRGKPAAAALAAKPRPAKPAPAPPQPPKNGANVNLAAWGQGKENHPFCDIRTAIEERLGCSVTDPHAALEALIDKGVVAFKDARKDLLPPAVEVEDPVDA